MGSLTELPANLVRHHWLLSVSIARNLGWLPLTRNNSDCNGNCMQNSILEPNLVPIGGIESVPLVNSLQFYIFALYLARLSLGFT